MKSKFTYFCCISSIQNKTLTQFHNRIIICMSLEFKSTKNNRRVFQQRNTRQKDKLSRCHLLVQYHKQPKLIDNSFRRKTLPLLSKLTFKYQGFAIGPTCYIPLSLSFQEVIYLLKSHGTATYECGRQKRSMNDFCPTFHLFCSWKDLKM